MRLLIVRHGQSEADILNVHEGRADFELTELGRRQAAAASRRIYSEYGVTKIYSSTLRRAYQTAEYLAELTGLPINADAELMEFNNGLLAGCTREYAEEHYPRLSGLPLHAAVYEQESALEFRFRAERVLSRMIHENQGDGTIAVFSHGGMINQLCRAFMRLPMDSDVGWQTGDTGIHEWLVQPGMRRICMSNSVSHTEGMR